MRLDVTPTLAEAAVRAVLDRRPGAAPRHAADVVREFGDLGLAAPVFKVAGEFPDVVVPKGVLGGGPGDEGVYLSPRRDEVRIALRPDRFTDLPAVERFLRHEWRHISDMVDPSFEYPSAPETNYVEAVRERYALLWAIFCDARTIAAGREPLRPREDWKGIFERGFSSYPDAAAVFDTLWDSRRPSHHELWHISIEPSRVIRRFGGNASHGPRTPGQHCSLCGFPTFDWRDAPAEALDAIKADFPAWDARDGLCGRCGEVYEVRAGIWR